VNETTWKKPRHRWEDDIKMDFWETGWMCGLNRPGSGYGQVVGSFECGNEHSVSIRLCEFRK
jgi:hypothetical protein